MIKIKMYFLYYRVPGVMKNFKCSVPAKFQDFDHALTHSEASYLLRQHRRFEKDIEWQMRSKYVEAPDCRLKYETVSF